MIHIWVWKFNSSWQRFWFRICQDIFIKIINPNSLLQKITSHWGLSFSFSLSLHFQYDGSTLALLHKNTSHLGSSLSLSLSLHFQCDQSTLALFIPQCNSLTSAPIGDLQDVPPNSTRSSRETVPHLEPVFTCICSLVVLRIWLHIM